MSLIGQITAIARITFTESRRNKGVLILVVSGLCLLCAGLVLSSMAVGDHKRVILHTGFWVIGIYGLISNLFLGLNSIYGDLVKKIVYMIFSRPVKRWTFVVGKFFGMVWVCFGVYAGLAVGFTSLLLLTGTAVTENTIIALSFLFVEWCLLAGFSVLFASFTSPLLHAFFLTMIYFIGHWTNYLYAYASNAESAMQKTLLLMVYYTFPNLEALNYRTFVFQDKPIDGGIMLTSLLTALLWLLSALFASGLIFSHRDLK